MSTKGNESVMDVDSGSDSESVLTNQDQACDLSAYELFHVGNIGACCLSFDILKDSLCEQKHFSTPVSCTLVTGTQATNPISNLRKAKDINSEDDDSDEIIDSDEEDGPVLCLASIKHEGCVNRLRVTEINNNHIAASWSEVGVVNIWNLSNLLGKVQEGIESLDTVEEPIKQHRHSSEGFALDWSKVEVGTLLSGDCSSNILLWKPVEGGTWNVCSQAFKAHTDSVEDLQWSPNEPHVFASASVDKTIRIWDDRASPLKACMITCNAHQSDINVIHWNALEPYIVSGGDDHYIKVWDLRQIKSSADPVASFNYHSGSITTIEWHPTDSSVFASGGEDDQVLQWDLAVERDSKVADCAEEDKDVPQQLMFVHKGQRNVKELHWHPQIPGLLISTAQSGFNIFKTISI